MKMQSEGTLQMNYGHLDKGSRSLKIKCVVIFCSLCFMTLMKKEKGQFVFLFKISERLKTDHLIILYIYAMCIHSLHYPVKVVVVAAGNMSYFLITIYKYEYCANSSFLEREVS